MFNLPIKEIIVNDDTQVVLLEDDGTAYQDNDMNATTGGFKLQGFLEEITWAAAAAAAGAPAGIGAYLKLLATTTRMIKDTPSTGTAEVKRWAVGSTSSPADAGFRLVADGLELGSTEFQANAGREKRYQISAAQASAVAIAAKVAATINADPKAPATATVTNGYVVLTAKVKGVRVSLYSNDFIVYNTSSYTSPATWSRATTTVTVTYPNHGLTTGDSITLIQSSDTTATPLGAETVTVTNGNVFTFAVADAGGAAGTLVYTIGANTLAALPVNTYDYLKNINWAKNLDFDRNSAWFPQQGVSYNSYYFVVVSPDPITGGLDTPGQVQPNVETQYKLYVKTGTTLATAMDFLVGDVNQ